MTGPRLRTGLRPGDLEALSTLTATSRTAVLGPALLEDLLRAGDDERTVVIIADGENGPLGFVHLEISPRGSEAWLVSGAVDPRRRREGIGSALLTAATGTAREWGAAALQISGRPHGYAAPGIDVAADPATAAFLDAHGGLQSGSALSMHRTLHDLEPIEYLRPVGSTDSTDASGSIQHTQSTARSPSVDIRSCSPDDLDELYDLVRDQLAVDWAQTLQDHARRGGGLERILLARSASQELLGFACWGVVGRDPARFGPFGVIPAAREHGAGGALLDAALVRMAGDGLAHAWFQWTGPGSPAHRLYLSRGFTALRTFIPYTVPTDHVGVAGTQEGTTR